MDVYILDKKQNEIKECVESKGYEILNISSIISFRDRLNLICKNGHERNCSYEAFRKTSRCKKCIDENKLSELVNEIKALGYTFIILPENGKSVVKAMCPNGHIREAKIHNFKNFGCGICSGKPVKKDIDFCRKTFEDRGFTLLDDEYIDCKTPMRYKCTCGREKTKTLDAVLHHKKLDSCNECKGKKCSGELGSNWQGGLTSKTMIMRGRVEYKNWRTYVFQRDKYTCQCCGAVGGRLRGHHIFSWHDNEHLRYDVDNGITLCDECHDIGKKDSFHSIYGAGNNTREQLDEFINNHNI